MRTWRKPGLFRITRGLALCAGLAVAGPAAGQVPSPAAAPEAPRSQSPATRFAAPSVACDPGQAVRYEGAKAFTLWVTRSGTITIDNPLRPLTPDTTRVLQLVIDGKVATAYGPDLAGLRRGGTPAALEGLVGGPLRWDANLVALPDVLTILADGGAPLADLRFKACGDAPAARTLPTPTARKGPGPAPGKAPASEKARGPAKAAARPAGAPADAAAAKTSPSRRLPQGALPDGAMPPP